MERSLLAMPNRQPVEIPADAPTSRSASSADRSSGSRSRWSKPVLTVYGDVRQLTMGLSNPPGESGNPGARHP
jgi:hypothetical protein